LQSINLQHDDLQLITLNKGDLNVPPQDPPPRNQRLDGHAQHDDLVAHLVGAVVIAGDFLLVFLRSAQGLS
jgi:uncharacterized membrane protein